MIKQLYALSDGSNIDLVYIDNKSDSPYCKLHGAMNKVCVGKDGIWRCIRAEMGTEGIKPSKMEEYKRKKKERDCRAGCKYY